MWMLVSVQVVRLQPMGSGAMSSAGEIHRRSNASRSAVEYATARVELAPHRAPDRDDNSS